MAIFGQRSDSRIFYESGFEFTRQVETQPNTVIVYGGLAGVTTEYTGANKLSWAACDGTFSLQSEAYSALTFAKGDLVKVTVADNVGTVSASGTVAIGRAVKDKAAGTNDVVVMLIQNAN